MPPIIHPRDPWPLAPPVSSPDLFLSPAAEPTAAPPSPRQSTATPTFIQPTELSTQSSSPPSLQPAPSTLLSTVQSLNHTAIPEIVNTREESGDISGESGDMPEGSGDMSGESGDIPQDSPDTAPW